jgi:hypothetical protein
LPDARVEVESIDPASAARGLLIAAKRAGARIFFVPRENYPDIAGERDPRVIPVDTFRQAVRVIDGERENEPAEARLGNSMSTHQRPEPRLVHRSCGTVRVPGPDAAPA